MGKVDTLELGSDTPSLKHENLIWLFNFVHLFAALMLNEVHVINVCLYGL